MRELDRGNLQLICTTSTYHFLVSNIHTNYNENSEWIFIWRASTKSIYFYNKFYDRIAVLTTIFQWKIFSCKKFHEFNRTSIFFVSNIYLSLIYVFYCWIYLICRNKRPGRLTFRNNKNFSETHHSPSVLCTPPCEKITHQKPIGFVYSLPLKNHPSKPIGFVYSPLWKITLFSGRSFRQIRYVPFTWLFPTVYRVKNSFSLKNACTSWLMHLKDLPFISWCWTPSTTITYEYSLNIINMTRTSTVKKEKKSIMCDKQ